jgi:hypothetical protein
MGLWRARCGANSHAGFGGAGRGNGPSERAAPRPGSTLLLPARRRPRVLVGQRPPPAQRPRPQDRRQRCGLDLPAGRARPWSARASCHPGRSASCATSPATARSSSRSAPARRERLEKVLEDAGVKLSSVASDVLGVSGRAMLAALIGGSCDPAAMAELAKGRLRAKLPELRAALRGHFDAHHGLLAAEMLTPHRRRRGDHPAAVGRDRPGHRPLRVGAGAAGDHSWGGAAHRPG